MKDDDKSTPRLAEDKGHVDADLLPLSSRLRYRLTEVPPIPILFFIALQVAGVNAVG